MATYKYEQGQDVNITTTPPKHGPILERHMLEGEPRYLVQPYPGQERWYSADQLSPYTPPEEEYSD